MWLLGMLTIDLINSTLNCFQKKTKTIEFLSGFSVTFQEVKVADQVTSPAA